MAWSLAQQAIYQLLRESAPMREKIAALLFDRTRPYVKHCLAFIRNSPKLRYQHLLAHAPQVVQWGSITLPRIRALARCTCVVFKK